MLLKEGARADIIDNVSIVIHNLLTISNEYCLMNAAQLTRLILIIIVYYHYTIIVCVNDSLYRTICILSFSLCL